MVISLLAGRGALSLAIGGTTERTFFIFFFPFVNEAESDTKGP